MEEKFTKEERNQASQFAHLHNHSDYSMLDGAARVPDLIKKAKYIGQTAIGLTDHGNMYGAYKFWKEATKEGIKPVIGIEAYVTPGTARTDKSRVSFSLNPNDDKERSNDDVSNRGIYTHMTMWAKNNKGLHNLFKAVSIASLDSPYAKYPRFDLDLIERFSEGVIATSGCPSGEIQTRLRLGQFDLALKKAAQMQDIYGRENYYIELMNHKLDLEYRVKDDLLRIAKKLNAPIVATNDSHYVSSGDERSHDALLCINSGSRLTDPNRFKFDGEGYYIRTTAEMKNAFSEYPEAISNSLLIAESCNVSFDEGVSHMPKFVTPNGESEEDYLRQQVREKIGNRYPNMTDAIKKQVEYELDVICSKGYAGYFLVVADFIGWAKSQGIKVGPGRGSAAGSLVSYALAITEVDPLLHGLIFERFLNPERESMPDIDIDIEERRREEVIRYVEHKYGEDKVSQIITYGTIKAKQALKDSARILDYPYSFGEQLTKAIPKAISGKEIKLSEIFDENHPRYHEAKDFRDLYKSNEDFTKIVDLARGIEGLIRQWGVHAAGVIMSDVPITDVEPVIRRLQDGAVITQFDYPTSEALGLIKMDFLGLRNLNILGDAQRIIKENRGEDIILEDLPLDDPKTFELLAKGDTLGIFQLDSEGIRSLLRSIRPDKFDDISACIALFRPGPMGMGSHTNYAKRKNGLQKIDSIHPELEKPLKSILDETYGLVVYQEQVQRIAQALAGYTLGASDNLRRAMGKKKKEVLEKEYVPFSEGMKKNGYSDEAIKKIWDILVPFSDYAFNKAHSASYGVIAYWTAYLKANYPSEYMAALLTSTVADRDRSSIYLNECRRMKIKVLTPDVNESENDFTVIGKDIRYGLGAIKSIGGAISDSILQARKEKGKFTSFFDFLYKVPANVCNKRILEHLIKAGAFDSFDLNRRQLMAIHETTGEIAAKMKAKQSRGMSSLFAGVADDNPEIMFNIDVPNLDEWDKNVKLEFESEMLGMYISDHPLSDLEDVLAANSDISIAELTDSASSDEIADVDMQGDEISGSGSDASVAGADTSSVAGADTGSLTDVGVDSSLGNSTRGTGSGKNIKPRVPNYVSNGSYDQKYITLAGMISQAEVRMSKNGKLWGSYELEDLTGRVHFVFFGRSFEENNNKLQKGNVIKLYGRVDVRDESDVSIIGSKAEKINFSSSDDSPLMLTIDANDCTKSYLQNLYGLLQRHKGSIPIKLYIVDEDGKNHRVDLMKDVKVDKDDSLFTELKAYFGKDLLGKYF